MFVHSFVHGSQQAPLFKVMDISRNEHACTIVALTVWFNWSQVIFTWRWCREITHVLVVGKWISNVTTTWMKRSLTCLSDGPHQYHLVLLDPYPRRRTTLLLASLRQMLLLRLWPSSIRQLGQRMHLAPSIVGVHQTEEIAPPFTFSSPDMTVSHAIFEFHVLDHFS